MCAKYNFEKPNDRRALDLMNTAAKAVVADLPDITLAYGVSDEYSKLITTVVSTFTANYVHSWPTHFPDTPLTSPLPTFDGRAVCYPTVQNLRDYLSWRQADCHINNLYNTAFWSLIQLGGIGNKEAEKTLAGTLAADKNEIMFSRFGINYNREPEMYKKGSVIFRDPVRQSKTQTENDRKRRAKARILVDHLDIIKDDFWDRRPWILSNKPGKVPKET
ncbi:tRNA(His) guanylyltransferase [Geosmithia morbida]|uniref:tRNA(His) guanylyltransferase n=1 Tax=Geosmithia morbida TaxID=1094350 RepID=A0A9P4Z1Z5_9HYPO|nr:tRNA(His) guanylyltransferase [Geosmithia morbida]KAF4125174.1 tRNA(His) guanylyltransferase [Geosmithia morbida]